MLKADNLKLAGRLFLRAKRHRGWILLTILCMAVFSGLYGLRLMLLKPLTDQVLLARMLNPALLRADDILDWPAFCTRLAGAGSGPASNRPSSPPALPDTLALRVWEGLSEDGRAAARETVKTHTYPQALRTRIVNAVNEALKRLDLFVGADRHDAAIPEDARALLAAAAATQSESERTRLNRRVLQVAFPDVLAPMESDAAPVETPWWSRLISLSLVDDPRWNTLLNIALLIGLLTPFLVLFDYLQEYLFRLSTMKIIVDFRNQVIEHLVRLSMRFYADRRTGDMMSRVSNDILVTQSALDFLFGDILLQGFMLVSAMAVAVAASWRMSLFIVLFAPLIMWPLIRLGKRIRKSRRRSLIRLGDLTQAMYQMFSGIRIVKAFEMEAQEAREFAARNEHFYRESMKVARAKALSAAIMQFLETFILLAFVLWGGYLIVKAKYGISEGDFVTFVAACMVMNRPLKVLGKAYSSLQEALAACERVFELMDTPLEIEDAPDAVVLPRVERGVVFEGVHFAYDAEPVLRDVALSARPGEIIALVGPSGAGKSTLCDLICRFYDPTRGRITLDGIDLRRLRRQSLLGHIAVVSQETFLFHASVADNIRYGKRDATDEEVVAAAGAANIHDFIATLDKGYLAVVGERGAKLSGGQRQRIAIARAILKDPAILILDEATSALDTENERLVQDALNRLMVTPTRGHQGRLTFVIAHRLSTIQKADRIVVLEAGRIVEQGTHDELLKRGGLYERLYRMQFQMAEA